MPSKYEGRMRRIRAKNPEMGQKEVRALAAKRAKKYKQRTSAQKANASRGVAIGRGKKGTLKRKVWKAGGTSTDLKALKVQPKSVRKSIKKSSRQKNYDIKGTAANMKKSRAYKGKTLEAQKPKDYAPKKPKVPKPYRAVPRSSVGSVMKRAAGIGRPRML